MQIGDDPAQVPWIRSDPRRQRDAASPRALLQHLDELGALLGRQSRQRLLGCLRILVRWHGVRHIAVPVDDLPVRISLSGMALLVPVHEVFEVVPLLSSTEQFIEYAHVPLLSSMVVICALSGSGFCSCRTEDDSLC